MVVVKRLHQVLIINNIMNERAITTQMVVDYLNNFTRLEIEPKRWRKWKRHMEESVFEEASRSGVFTDPPIHLKTEPIATTQSRPIKEALEQSYQDLVEKIDSFTRNGSGGF